jgi:hypothetical protein
MGAYQNAAFWSSTSDRRELAQQPRQNFSDLTGTRNTDSRSEFGNVKGAMMNDMPDEIRGLRARAEFYRKLANGLMDRRTARETLQYALELEAAAMQASAAFSGRAEARSKPLLPVLFQVE